MFLSFLAQLFKSNDIARWAGVHIANINKNSSKALLRPRKKHGSHSHASYIRAAGQKKKVPKVTPHAAAFLIASSWVGTWSHPAAASGQAPPITAWLATWAAGLGLQVVAPFLSTAPAFLGNKPLGNNEEKILQRREHESNRVLKAPPNALAAVLPGLLLGRRAVVQAYFSPPRLPPPPPTAATSTLASMGENVPASLPTSASQAVPGRMKLTLHCDSPNAARRAPRLAHAMLA